MLSIRFGGSGEWWVSGRVFDRLFQAALDNNELPQALEEWRHVADANGGFDISAMPAQDADRLKTAFRTTAELEIARMGSGPLDPEDDSYRVSLLKLLVAVSSPQASRS